MKAIRGKSLKAITWDIAEGYVTVNPLFLKPLELFTIKDLYMEVHKVMIEIRGAKFPYNDILAIRARNLMLQRLNAAGMIIRNYLKDKRLIVF